MSWDGYEFDKQSSCVCGNGIVIKHCYREYDDWNRSRSGHTGIEIQCPDCETKYHYDSITRHRRCPSWEGDGFYTKEYLVPKGLNIPSVITPKSFFYYNHKEEIVSYFTKKELEEVIIDMRESKYSTRVQKDESKLIVSICNKRIHTKSLSKIIPILQEILSSYDKYKWNPVTIAEYKQQEADIIKQNEDNIANVISKSYELHFLRKDN